MRWWPAILCPDTLVLFRSLPSDEIEDMISWMQLVNVAKGEAIITQGEKGLYFYVVEKVRPTRVLAPKES